MNKTIYALGFFDGVHLGHLGLLRICRKAALKHGCRCGVITFASHPDTLVQGKTPGLINTPEDRERLLKAQDMDTIVTLPFDEAMRSMPWQDFFRLLTEEYGAAGFIVGEDFRFGYGGEGTALKLKALCQENNLFCIVFPRLTLNRKTISSTYIRTLLKRGRMEKAVRFLGHPHILTGTVVAGRRIGHTIGVPTANMLLPEGLLVPKRGAYACMCMIDGEKYPAVTNVGTCPTVGGDQITVETFVLNFDGDLYGQEITLEFHKFLRREKKFPSLSRLQAEIKKNALETLVFFQKR